MNLKIITLISSLFCITSFAGSPSVIIETNHGSISIELNEKKAPLTVKNFIGYVEKKFYDNTIFHRIIDGFMIQGGGFSNEDPPAQKKPDKPIKNEGKSSGLSNVRGSIAMARTSDPNSATSQFFINVSDNRNLDGYGGGYAVFGKVVDGMAVVNQIKSVPTANKDGMRDVPKNSVIIKQIRRID